MGRVIPGAGTISWDAQGFHGGPERFWWRTDRANPDDLPLFEGTAMRRGWMRDSDDSHVPVCPVFRYFGRRVYDDRQLEAHWPGANAVVVVTNLPELLHMA